MSCRGAHGLGLFGEAGRQGSIGELDGLEMDSVFDRRRAAVCFGAALVLLAGCGTGSADAEETLREGSGVQRLGVEVVDTFDHDATAFTQGLELRDGVFYESTGLYGSS